MSSAFGILARNLPATVNKIKQRRTQISDLQEVNKTANNCTNSVLFDGNQQIMHPALQNKYNNLITQQVLLQSQGQIPLQAQTAFNNSFNSLNKQQSQLQAMNLSQIQQHVLTEQMQLSLAAPVSNTQMSKIVNPLDHTMDFIPIYQNENPKMQEALQTIIQDSLEFAIQGFEVSSYEQDQKQWNSVKQLLQEQLGVYEHRQIDQMIDQDVYQQLYRILYSAYYNELDYFSNRFDFVSYKLSQLFDKYPHFSSTKLIINYLRHGANIGDINSVLSFIFKQFPDKENQYLSQISRNTSQLQSTTGIVQRQNQQQSKYFELYNLFKQCKFNDVIKDINLFPLVMRGPLLQLIQSNFSSKQLVDADFSDMDYYLNFFVAMVSREITSVQFGELAFADQLAVQVIRGSLVADAELYTSANQQIEARGVACFARLLLNEKLFVDQCVKQQLGMELFVYSLLKGGQIVGDVEDVLHDTFANQFGAACAIAKKVQNVRDAAPFFLLSYQLGGAVAEFSDTQLQGDAQILEVALKFRAQIKLFKGQALAAAQLLKFSNISAGNLAGQLVEGGLVELLHKVNKKLAIEEVDLDILSVFVEGAPHVAFCAPVIELLREDLRGKFMPQLLLRILRSEPTAALKSRHSVVVIYLCRYIQRYGGVRKQDDGIALMGFASQAQLDHEAQNLVSQVVNGGQ